MTFATVKWINMDVRFLPTHFDVNQVEKAIRVASGAYPKATDNLAQDIFVAVIKDDKNIVARAGSAKGFIATAVVPFTPNSVREALDGAMRDLASCLSAGTPTPTTPFKTAMWDGIEVRFHYESVLPALNHAMNIQPRIRNSKLPAGSFIVCGCWDTGNAAVLVAGPDGKQLFGLQQLRGWFESAQDPNTLLEVIRKALVDIGRMCSEYDPSNPPKKLLDIPDLGAYFGVSI